MFEINKKLSLKNGNSQSPQAKPKMLDPGRTELRTNHYRKKTEEVFMSRINTKVNNSFVLNKGLGVKSPLDWNNVGR